MSRQSRGNLRRFRTVAIAANLIAAIPFLGILWSLWGPVDVLRHTRFQSNFYDLQGRAVLHGHLWIPDNSIGVEGFVVGGHTYTYFGIFPSLLRLPILAVTTSLDGKLGAPSILLAWIAVALFSTLLVWRVRVVARGDAPLGWGETYTLGLLLGVISGGSVLLYLAGTPYVFSEDLMWSVALTVAAIFGLLGLLERPTWGRWIFATACIVLANQDRLTTGWSCVVGAVLVAGWFRFTKAGAEHRRWWLPTLGSGVLALVLSVLINEAKFGSAFGLPIQDQVYTHVNAYRRHFLATSGGEEGIVFAPSDIWAYLRPNGLRFTSAFPFVTLPSFPASNLGGVLFDRRYRTASVPASMPFLFLATCWGLVASFRPKPLGRLMATRPLLLAAGGAGAALFLWGYIAPRYLADFMPLLILGSAVGLIDLWARLEGRSRRTRRLWFVSIALLAAFTAWANFAITISPTEEWTMDQVANFVHVQSQVGHLLGTSLAPRTIHVDELPSSAPADQLAIVGACDGFYISTGEDYSPDPTNALQRANWLPISYGPQFFRTFLARIGEPAPGTHVSAALAQAGDHTVAISISPARPGRVEVTFTMSSHGAYLGAYPVDVPAGRLHRITVLTDSAKHEAEVTMDGQILLQLPLTDGEPVSTPSTPEPTKVLALTNVTPRAEPALCGSVLRSLP